MEKKFCQFCGKELEQKSLNILGETKPAFYIECECEGAKQAREIEEREKEEQAIKEEREKLARDFKNAGIPKRYMSIRQCEYDYHRLTRFYSPFESIYIHGGVGVGKTQQAVELVRYVIGNLKVQFINERDLFANLRDDVINGGNKLVAQCKCADVLIIDDIGKTKPTEFVVGELYGLVNRFYEDEKHLILTSQLSVSQLGEHLAKYGEKDTALAIVSRLYEMCNVIALHGKDRRLKGAKNE